MSKNSQVSPNPQCRSVIGSQSSVLHRWNGSQPRVLHSRAHPIPAPGSEPKSGPGRVHGMLAPSQLDSARSYSLVTFT